MSARRPDPAGDSRGAGAGSSRRRPSLGGGRRPLLGASVLVMLGGVLPWVYTGAGPVSGTTGGGLYAFYAGALGLAGALVPWRTAAVVQAGILAVVAVVLPVWQLVHLYSLIGLQGWLPGPGLVLVLGGGVLAGTAARSLATGR